MICIDVETGGLDVVNNQIFSLGMLNMENDAEFYRECRHTHGVISDWSRENLDIEFDNSELPDMDMVEGDALLWLDKQIGPDFRVIPVGHNFHYDRKWIDHWMPRLGKRLIHRYRDTSVLANALVDAGWLKPWKNLLSLADQIGIRFTPHHAMEDVRATAEIWTELVDRIRART